MRSHCSSHTTSEPAESTGTWRNEPRTGPLPSPAKACLALPLCVSATLLVGPLASGQGACPSLSTLLGGSGEDLAYAVAVDPSTGHFLVAGLTDSPDLPAQTGVFDTTHNGGKDIFVARFDPASTGLSQLLWLSYLGGDGYDTVFPDGISVHPDGRIAIVGQTGSLNFPTTTGAFDQTPNHTGGINSDAFVAVLAADGSSLLYSTYLGGSGPQFGDWAWAGEWDAQGRIVVGGFTQSSNFPTTASAYSTVYSGGGDAFLSVLNPSGAGAADLVFSSYLGASGGAHDEGIVALENVGNGIVNVTGVTWTGSFPTTPGCYDPGHNGSVDAFFAQLDTSASGAGVLLYSTFLGGSGQDIPRDLINHSDGSVTIVGGTEASGFPTTPNALQPVSAGGGDGFVTRIAPTGAGATDLVYSTYLGGGSLDTVMCISAAGGGDRVLLGGTSSSAGFPVTPGACDVTGDSAQDGFVATMSLGSTPPTLDYASFLGDAGVDIVYKTAALYGGEGVFSGSTGTGNFPTTAQAYDTTYGGGAWDAFVAKIQLFSSSGAGCTILNGDFSLGNVGFESNTVFFPPLQPFQPSAFGTYTIAATPTPSNGAWCGVGHTTGADLFLICDGVQGAPTVAWRQASPVTPGLTYEFEAWVTNLVCTQSLADPVMELRVNSQTVAGPIALPENSGWVRLAGTFTSSTPYVELEVVSVSTAGNGNDFGVDDIRVTSLGVEPDCNVNGTPDICEIAQGLALDLNANAVPDSCEAVGTSYCSPAVGNSTGQPGVISALGSIVASDNDLWLWAHQLPPNQTGYFLGNSVPGSIAMPGDSQGVLCLGAGPDLGRFAAQAQNSGAPGVIGIPVDLGAVPVAAGMPRVIVAGDTWHFQSWYRDQNPGSTSNFTDAVSVTFN